MASAAGRCRCARECRRLSVRCTIHAQTRCRATAVTALTARAINFKDSLEALRGRGCPRAARSSLACRLDSEGSCYRGGGGGGGGEGKYSAGRYRWSLRVAEFYNTYTRLLCFIYLFFFFLNEIKMNLIWINSSS